MIAYLARRIIQSLLILLGVSLITFALLYLLPADPVRQIAGRSATPETVENIRRQLGLVGARGGMGARRHKHCSQQDQEKRGEPPAKGNHGTIFFIAASACQ